MAAPTLSSRSSKPSSPHTPTPWPCSWTLLPLVPVAETRLGAKGCRWMSPLVGAVKVRGQWKWKEHSHLAHFQAWASPCPWWSTTCSRWSNLTTTTWVCSCSWDKHRPSRVARVTRDRLRTSLAWFNATLGLVSISSPTSCCPSLRWPSWLSRSQAPLPPLWWPPRWLCLALLLCCHSFSGTRTNNNVFRLADPKLSIHMIMMSQSLSQAVWLSKDCSSSNYDDVACFSRSRLVQQSEIDCSCLLTILFLHLPLLITIHWVASPNTWAQQRREIAFLWRRRQRRDATSRSWSCYWRAWCCQS